MVLQIMFFYALGFAFFHDKIRSRWIPGLGTMSEDREVEDRKVELNGMIVRMASLNMTVDVLDEGKDKEQVVARAHQHYIPKEMYSDFSERLLSSGKVMAKDCE